MTVFVENQCISRLHNISMLFVAMKNEINVMHVLKVTIEKLPLWMDLCLTNGEMEHVRIDI